VSCTTQNQIFFRWRDHQKCQDSGNKSSKQALVAEVDQVLPSWLFHYDEEISAKSDLCIFYKNYEIFVG
jgi:hypothetical protein